MSMMFAISLTTGFLALIGLCGILMGATLTSLQARHRIFRIGTVAMTAAGLIMLLGGLIGFADAGMIFGGLMLVIFGTATSLPKDSDPASV